MHLAAVGILFCFARWPIFGRPRQAEPEPVADFGKHIDALALLLERSRDRSYAMARVLHYQQTTAADKNGRGLNRHRWLDNGVIAKVTHRASYTPPTPIPNPQSPIPIQ